jgi:hypothetical protein
MKFLDKVLTAFNETSISKPVESHKANLNGSEKNIPSPLLEFFSNKP